MRMRSIVAVAFLSMVASTGALNASSSIASDAGRVDTLERMGHGGSTYLAVTPQAGDHDAVGTEQRTTGSGERIGHGGSIYRLQPDRVGERSGEQGMIDGIKRIGAGGSIYFSSQPMS